MWLKAGTSLGLTTLHRGKRTQCRSLRRVLCADPSAMNYSHDTEMVSWACLIQFQWSDFGRFTLTSPGQRMGGWPASKKDGKPRVNSGKSWCFLPKKCRNKVIYSMCTCQHPVFTTKLDFPLTPSTMEALCLWGRTWVLVSQICPCDGQLLPCHRSDVLYPQHNPYAGSFQVYVFYLDKLWSVQGTSS